MLVKDLIELLQTLPQDYEVIMSKDSEGNHYSPFHSFVLAQYIPDNTWSGEIVTEEDQQYAEYHEPEPYVENSVVLFPVN
jgi:hypothetical protein